MTSVREAIRRLFTPVQPLPAGIYHFQAPPEDPRNYRLHLRVEPDGKAVLIVNAATILHLNQTAAEYAYHLVKGTPKAEAVQEVASRYRVNEHQVRQDYDEFLDRIETLITTPDLDPVTFLDFGRREPYPEDSSAPYRLDCALTYRLPDSVAPDVAPIQRVARELSAEEWMEIFDRAWQAGIPHLVFTGGEPTLREDLSRLIDHAESNGQVTGLITDGLRLADAGYLKELLQTGLDHILIILQPELPATWEALQNAVQADIFTAAHLTMTSENKGMLLELLDRLAAMGLHAVSLSVNSASLGAELQEARDRAAALGLTLVWDLPVPYSALNPVSLEVENGERPDGAASAWLYVEPDGDVLPAQGLNHSLGNLLADPWEKVWAAARQFRSRG